MGKKEKKDKIEKGIEKYLKIKDLYPPTDFDINSDFAKEFDAFYLVRRNEVWRKEFFGLFKEVRETPAEADFKTILTELHTRLAKLKEAVHSTIEASFVSKMLHTVKPDMPIWDSIVLSKLDYAKEVHPYKMNCLKDDEARLNKCEEVYNKLINWYKGEEAEKYREQFDSDYPEYKDKLGRTKKIDFMLWGTEEKLDKVFEEYEAIYNHILSSFYPSLGNTGFQERNLTVNFSKAYEKTFAHDDVFSWFELQFGENKNNHLDCLIVNRSQKELFLIEAKRFSNTIGKKNSVLEDVERINGIAKAKTDDRFQEFKDFKVFGVILADVWQENQKKKDLYESFKQGDFFKGEPLFADRSPEYYVRSLTVRGCKAEYDLLACLWEILLIERSSRRRAIGLYFNPPAPARVIRRAQVSE